jgi:endonuclease/exonuclease/phosphatase (EEP) superfamily protein YafD
VGWLALGFSAILWLLQRPLGLSFRWPIAAFLEIYPYWLVIPCLGWLVLLKVPKTRWGWAPLAIATVFLVMNLAPIWQWWAGSPPRPSVGIETRSTPVPLRVMSYNLWIDNLQVDDIVASVQTANPDLLFLAEISSEMMETLSDRLDYPYRYRAEGGNNALMSRLPFLSIKTEDFGSDNPNLTLSLSATLDFAGQPLTFVGIHPTIPAPAANFHDRNQVLDQAANYAQQVKTPIVLVGDFNTSSWSPYLSRFASRANLTNVGVGARIFGTWNYRPKSGVSWLKVPIDHIFTRGLRLKKAWAGSPGGSDHRPVLADLQWFG